MLVVPLVVFSLICGVLGIGDIRVLGRVGGKSFVLYIATTAIAIATAIVLGVLIGPGRASRWRAWMPQASPPPMRRPSGGSFANIVPSNPVAALANGDMLQIIFYVIIVGIAALMLGNARPAFAQACRYLNELAMKIVEIVMALPLWVFALIAKVSPRKGSAFHPGSGL